MFRFKQFSIQDSLSAMKVGTDSVLLATWIEKKNQQESILDVGTGCGVIALILAQRMRDSTLLAIDIDTASIIQATTNSKNSPFAHQMEVQECKFQDFSKSTNKKFSLIVSNPPYFHQSLQGQKQTKNIARHSGSLSFSELIQGASLLLADDGRFCCVVPVSEWERLVAETVNNDLFCEKMTQVYTKREKQAQLILSSFCRHKTSTVDDDLYITDTSGEYTSDYLRLTADFYLFA